MKSTRNILQFVRDLMPSAILICVMLWAMLEKKYGILFPLAAILLFLVVGVAWGGIDVRKKRRQGIYPQKGQATMADVKRLALSRNKDLALRAYLEFNDVTLAKAKQEVNKIIADAQQKKK